MISMLSVVVFLNKGGRSELCYGGLYLWMCFMVSVVLHEGHCGFDCPLIRNWCVVIVCVILSLEKIFIL